LATVTAVERECMLDTGRSFTFGSPETLTNLYGKAGVTPDP
jgi:hypothetical protein